MVAVVTEVEAASLGLALFDSRFISSLLLYLTNAVGFVVRPEESLFQVICLTHTCFLHLKHKVWLSYMIEVFVTCIYYSSEILSYLEWWPPYLSEVRIWNPNYVS